VVNGNKTRITEKERQAAPTSTQSEKLVDGSFPLLTPLLISAAQRLMFVYKHFFLQNITITELCDPQALPDKTGSRTNLTRRIE